MAQAGTAREAVGVLRVQGTEHKVLEVGAKVLVAGLLVAMEAMKAETEREQAVAGKEMVHTAVVSVEAAEMIAWVAAGRASAVAEMAPVVEVMVRMAMAMARAETVATEEVVVNERAEVAKPRAVAMQVVVWTAVAKRVTVMWVAVGSGREMMEAVETAGVVKDSAARAEEERDKAAMVAATEGAWEVEGMVDMPVGAATAPEKQ